MRMNALRGNLRNAASLIILNRISGKAARSRGPCNYDILVQTRTARGSFRNSVVFPGGVYEAADASPEWLQILQSFGFNEYDFAQLHHPDAPSTPLFKTDHILRHISLRITAIRETFEELGLLICARAPKNNKSDIWAHNINDIDIKHWQHKISNNPEEFVNLCKQHKCYPDIWSLHYWRNWLTPASVKKRFDTAFFITALDSKPKNLVTSSEVDKVEWASPTDILSRNKKSEIILYPPQSYELNIFEKLPDIEQLVKFAKERSNLGQPVFFHALINAIDGKALALPGDDLYPAEVNYNEEHITKVNKTILELRRDSHTVHRFEFRDSQVHLVLKNLKHINENMGETVIPVNVTLS